MGFFEDLAVRDLKIYANTLNGEVKHYRENSGLEIDEKKQYLNVPWPNIFGLRNKIIHHYSRINLGIIKRINKIKRRGASFF